MSGQRRSERGLGRGITIAAALSVVFVGLAVVTSPLLAALVVLPVSIAVGAVLGRSVPQATPHSLVTPSFSSVAVVNAPRASGAVGFEATSAA